MGIHKKSMSRWAKPRNCDAHDIAPGPPGTFAFRMPELPEMPDSPEVAEIPDMPSVDWAARSFTPAIHAWALMPKTSLDSWDHFLEHRMVREFWCVP